MPRPQNCRRVGQRPEIVYFKPRGIPLGELQEVVLALDELEALRLCDLDGLYHADAAERMAVSRATLGRIIESARRKISDALIHGKAIRFEGGNIIMDEQRQFQCGECQHSWSVAFGTPRPEKCPVCGNQNLHRQPDQTAQESGPQRGRGRCGQGRQRHLGQTPGGHRGQHRFGEGRGRGRHQRPEMGPQHGTEEINENHHSSGTE